MRRSERSVHIRRRAFCRTDGRELGACASVRGASTVETLLALVAVLGLAGGALHAVERAARGVAERERGCIERITSDRSSCGGHWGGDADMAQRVSIPFDRASADGSPSTELGAGLGSRILGFARDFARGAVMGDLAPSDATGHLAGSVAIGFVPFAGQVADLRDLGVAVRGLRDGTPSAWSNFGWVALGVVVPVVGDAAKVILRGDEAVAAAIAQRSSERVDLPEGGFVRAYREGDHVVKEVKDEVAGVGDVPVPLDMAGKERLVARLVVFTNQLTDAFGERLVPGLKNLGAGRYAQRYVTGLTEEELLARSPELAKHAEAEREKLMDKAARMLGLSNAYDMEMFPDGWVLRIDDHPTNFRYDEQGNIVAWFDPVAVHPRAPRGSGRSP